MTAILKPTNKMFCLLIFLSLFSAYSTKALMLERDKRGLFEEFNRMLNKEGNMKSLNVCELKERLNLNTLKGQDQDRVLSLLESLDENGDGEIEYSEFVRHEMKAIYNQKCKPQK